MNVVRVTVCIVSIVCGVRGELCREYCVCNKDCIVSVVLEDCMGYSVDGECCVVSIVCIVKAV